MPMIPGAFEMRPASPPARATGAIAVPVTRVVAPALASDRERLEREREGGGAPRERTGIGHRGVFGRLFSILVGRNR
jgi:hypothetical protein